MNETANNNQWLNKICLQTEMKSHLSRYIVHLLNHLAPSPLSNTTYFEYEICSNVKVGPETSALIQSKGQEIEHQGKRKAK